MSSGFHKSLVFHTEMGRELDRKVLESICKHFGLQIYVDEGRSGTSYMISGKTFVIDLFYVADVLSMEKEEKVPGDSQSIGSSARLAACTEQSLPTSRLRGLKLTLVEDAWTEHFTLFTTQLWLYIKKGDYVALEELLREFVAYDNDGSGERTFGHAVDLIREAESVINSSPLQEALVLSYAFGQHSPAIAFAYQSTTQRTRLIPESFLVIPFLPRKKLGALHLCREEYSIDRLAQILRTNADLASLLHVVADSWMYKVDLRLELKKNNITGASFLAFTPENGELAEFKVTPDLYIRKGGELDREMTVLLKRTESIYDVARMTGLVL